MGGTIAILLFLYPIKLKLVIKLILYSEWKPHLVKSNQQLVSSLGSEVVIPGVSVGKRAYEP